MRNTWKKRLLALTLAVCMLVTMSSGFSVMAEDSSVHYEEINGIQPVLNDDVAEEAPSEEPLFGENETVRAMIVLKGNSVLQQGYATGGIASNSGAMQYAGTLEQQQEAVAAQISEEVLGGAPLEVHWNLTLITNAMTADVRYGDLEAIEQVAGVLAVYVVPTYELDPREQDDLNTISSGTMTGSYSAWLDGYTGAGSRIAVVDTGLDVDHPSFNSDAFDYSLLVTSTKNDVAIADYQLLDTEEVASVLPKLHAYERYSGLTAKDVGYGDKVPFGFNYIDGSLDITHDNDSASDHGTHVSGIATANRYVQNADGTFTTASNGVVGVAPDAQLLVMKVFSDSGAYADDYMAAIEDAILLDCDSVNLSLGSATVGFTTAFNAYFDGVMAALSKTDTVVCMSCGNSGYWAEYANTAYGLLYAEDAANGRVGSPGAYENSLAVASADNIGSTGEYFVIAGENYSYADGAGKSFVGGASCKSDPFTSLDTSEDQSGTEYDFVFLGDPTDPDDTVKYGGTAEDFANVAGKIVLVSRGNGVNFTTKQELAAAAGAAGVIVYNNVYGFDTIYAACTKATPFITIRLDQAENILEAATLDENGCYGGKITVMSGVYTDMDAHRRRDYHERFFLLGHAGDLSLKPEITAPGGNIYSTLTDGKYGVMSGTSMASPSAAGMAAVVCQYIRENGLDEKTGMTARALAQSLMMGTAVPLADPNSEVEYSPRNQGSGLGNVSNAISSPTYITVDGNEDGKVKAELGDDPDRTGTYAFSFQVNNLTDRPVSYALEASVLAPMAVADEDGVLYTSMNDIALDTAVTVVSDQAGFDLNGDGTLDEGDVMAILAHVSGSAALAEAALADADLNGDGAVEAVDAQILSDILDGGSYEGKTLDDLKNNSNITVPANGSVHVSVTMKLTEDGRAYMEENYVNGNYVEGYVYLKAAADAEGRVAVTQSIPFLAFYGNWTDSSMLDRQHYAEDYFELAEHTPYLNRSRENYYTLKLRGNAGSLPGPQSLCQRQRLSCRPQRNAQRRQYQHADL